MVPIHAPIELHCHLRGEEYPNHPFAQWAFNDARAIGLVGFREMPNPLHKGKYLADLKTIYSRWEMIDSAYNTFGDINYNINSGLTNDREANQAILRRAAKDNPHGFVKAFFCHSTGNMGVLDPDDQKNLWVDAAEAGFRGVFMGHFEDEKRFRKPFDPAVPISHSERQDDDAEQAQVLRQLRFAYDAGFEGVFYVCHLSSPCTLDLIKDHRRLYRYGSSATRFRIVTEVTWHHMFLNTTAYNRIGNRGKCNPPLRSPAIQVELLDAVLNGEIDVLSSDHAPHPIERKDDPVNPVSGLPVLPIVPWGIRKLLELGMNPHKLNQTINETPALLTGWYNLIGQPWSAPEYDPKLWGKYRYNPFEGAA